MTTTKRPGPASRLREARRQQVFVDEEEDNANGGSGSARTVDMAFLSNGTSFVDGSGVGHVKVNESMDWSDVLRNDTTVHIIYQGSGSHEEILIIPVNETAPNSVDSSSGGSSGSDSESGSALPTGSSAGGSDSSTGDEGVAGTASSPLTLVIVASVLALISIAAVIAVVLYGRRNRRRAYSEDPSNTDMPFIVGHLPHQAAPELSVLDTDITPDLWVEGQYQYSPNMSGLQNSLNGTAILSDNNTTPAHHRLTVDAYPLGPNTRRGQRMARGNAQYSVAELVAKAEALVDQCQPELAVQFFEKALLQEPSNASLLDSIGELSTELDNPERALSAFQQSVALAPAQNPSKYFYLSQLVTGEEAERYTTQGITQLEHELQQHVDPSTPAALTIKKQICDAFCSLGELYMTDLCDHEEAEARCENYFQQAMKFDVGLPEPTQALANLRLVQQNKEAADGLLEETFRRLNENCDEESMPSLEFRTATGKMLIEVERYEQACDVLEGVMQEDDENAELWFLVGTCYRAMDDLPNALEFFEKCQTMLTKLKKELRDEFYLQDQLQSVEETIAELKTSIANRPPELDEESDSEEDEGADAETVGQQDVEMEE
ncbi:hypothetical protein PHYSODRAFT_255032 [Phytophthora sojae]|uniref:Uncharacterized protein n=1 Tax=Phytophthora sojae (strain P6497) TaxID=1094619 RepID=G4YV18_PHYSP|nr:hypothetical protein PHYSODRAFT_255032 [Phytophthora sojae]EGZ23688.1 hypothetical protein PHYSODRAFT_255032 [Phytophthora sojae]|eukprot:XP_009518976.1 hypothetical protein PHYSODRAFT_255032 [Phytophthora sojae]